ncbi:MAG: AI-2E family transporter [Acidobacteriota bacterium]|nr:AI-2E family transporter [Acidobacteriota bacterium]
MPAEEVLEVTETTELKEASRREGRARIRSFALTGLLILGCFYTLFFARDFFLPVILALVFNLLLGPLVRGLSNLHIPRPLGAALVILALFAGIGFVLWQLSGPISDWVSRVPEVAQKLQDGMRKFKKPVERVSQATEQVRSIGDPSPGSQKPPAQVQIAQPGPLAGLLTKTYSFIFLFVEFVVLLYFLLASGDMFLRKLIHVLPRLADKKRAVSIAREIEDSISRYLVTAALIDACLGSAGALVFWALGVPNPLLWGAMGGVLNFIPYLGALITVIVVGVVSAVTFPSMTQALWPPLAYFCLATLEGNFITPWILGRRLTLNPVVIFLAVTFWGWMWGIPGALLAVPMLAMFKIFCDHIEPLAPIGEFLGA